MLLFHSRTHSRNLWVCNYTRTPTAVNSFFFDRKNGNICWPGDRGSKARQYLAGLTHTASSVFALRAWHAVSEEHFL